MKILQQLVQLTDTKQLRLQQVFSRHTSKEIKIYKLHKGLVTNKIKSKEDALNLVYPDNKNGDRDLSKLKHELQHQLYNNILLYEFDKKQVQSHDRRPEYFKAQRNYVIAHFLILLNSRNLGIPILERILPDVIKEEFASLVIQSAKLLQQHYAVIKADIEKVEYYSNIVADWSSRYQADSAIEGSYLFLISQFNNRIPNEEVIQQLSKQYYNQSKRIYPSRPFASTIFRFAMIEIIFRKSHGEADAVVEICERAIEQLQSKSFIDRAATVTIYFQQMNSLMESEDYERLRATVDDALKLVSPGHFNWFKLKKFQYQALVAGHFYEEALGVYKGVIKKKQELERHQIICEEWKLVSLSVELLYRLGKITEKQYKKAGVIKVSKIVNEFSVANKNKQGLNVSIILFQVLHSILLKNYERAKEQLDAINTYKRRHLKGEEFDRVNHFIKMLNHLLSNWYDLSDIRTYSTTQLTTFDELSKAHIAMELIPFQQIWVALVEQIATIRKI